MGFERSSINEGFRLGPNLRVSQKRHPLSFLGLLVFIELIIFRYKVENSVKLTTSIRFKLTTCSA